MPAGEELLAAAAVAIDPDANTATVYRRAGARFVLAAAADPLTTPLLPGFAMPLDQLFT